VEVIEAVVEERCEERGEEKAGKFQLHQLDFILNTTPLYQINNSMFTIINMYLLQNRSTVSSYVTPNPTHRNNREWRPSNGG